MTEEFTAAKAELESTKKSLKTMTVDYDDTKEELDKVKNELDTLHEELGDFKTTQDNQNSLLQQKLSGEQELKSKIYNLNKELREKDRVFKETDAV